MQSRRLWTLVSIVAALATVMVWSPDPAVAVDGWTLTAFCTPAEGHDGFREFRVRNETDTEQDVILRNQNIGQQITVTAPIGDSYHLVPASNDPNAANTTLLIVDGEQKAIKNSNNRVCAALVGTAVCDPTTGDTVITWTIDNNDGEPANITDADGMTFTTDPVPAGGSVTATEPVMTPVAVEQRSLTVELTFASGLTTTLSDTVDVGACVAPAATGVTFTKTASTDTAAVGDLIRYTYIARNALETGNVEVTQVVDDRLGLVIEDPSVDTILGPGGSITVTVGYIVRYADAGTTIENHALLNVRTVEGDVRGDLMTAVAEASVVVADIPLPIDPPPPVAPPSSSTTTTAPTASSRVPVTLPATGTGNVTDAMIWMALALVASGALAIRLTRRA